MKRIAIALLISISVHVLFFAGLLILTPSELKKSEKNIEVTLEPPPKNQPQLKSKQIVRQVLTQDKLKTPEDETLTRLLSQQRQRVKKETQAPLNGITENRSGQISTSTEKKSVIRSIDISKELNEMKQLDQDQIKRRTYDQTPFDANLASGRSTVGDSLPTDVSVGSFTALNTDRYLYYSFYARVEELVRFRWETRVQQAVNGFDRISAMNSSGKIWNSQVEFLLDRNGVLQKALLMKASGIQSFDHAAIDAFKEARVFPNPPIEMVQEDGYIHLKFAFDVKYAPPVFVNK